MTLFYIFIQNREHTNTVAKKDEYILYILSNINTENRTAADSHSSPIAVNCSVPQGSVLGPIQFIRYTEDVADLFNRHSVNFHLFADDKQRYTCATLGHEAIARQKLSACINDHSGLVCISPAETQRVKDGTYLVRQSYYIRQNGDRSVRDRRFRGRAANRHCA